MGIFSRHKNVTSQLLASWFLCPLIMRSEIWDLSSSSGIQVLLSFYSSAPRISVPYCKLWVILEPVRVSSSTLDFSVPGTFQFTLFLWFLRHQAMNTSYILVLDPLILILSYPVLALCHTILYFSHAVLLIFSIYLALSSCPLEFAQSSSPLSPSIIWDLLTEDLWSNWPLQRPESKDDILWGLRRFPGRKKLILESRMHGKGFFKKTVEVV